MPTITRNRTKEKTERKAFITERTREHLSITKHDKTSSGIILQYKLIVTTDNPVSEIQSLASIIRYTLC